MKTKSNISQEPEIVHCVETKRRMSEEHKRKISEANNGKSKPHKGVKHSDEAKRKIGEASKRRMPNENVIRSIINQTNDEPETNKVKAVRIFSKTKLGKYWTKETDAAIVQYNLTKDDQLFNKTIYPALKRMSTHWVQSYNLPNTSADDLVTFLYTVLPNITDEKKNGYAFIGTCAKFYLYAKKKNIIRDDARMLPDDHPDVPNLEDYSHTQSNEPKVTIHYYSDESSPEIILLLQRLNSQDVPHHLCANFKSGRNVYYNFLFQDITGNKKELLGKIKWRRMVE